MPMPRLRLVFLGLVGLTIAGCATVYEWGAMEDPDWAPRIGSATFTQVTRELGQPVEKLQLPSGDMKARWVAGSSRPLTPRGQCRTTPSSGRRIAPIGAT